MALQLTSGAAAGAVATQLNQTVNNLATRAAGLIANGQAAITQGPQPLPAFTAAEFQAAMGTQQLASVQLAIAALNATDTTKLANALAALS